MQLVASALESRQGAGQGQGVVVVAKSIIGEISASAPQRTRIFPELWSDRDRIYPELDERQVDYALQALELWQTHSIIVAFTAHLPFICPVSTNT
jgi:hypothetical protein